MMVTTSNRTTLSQSGSSMSTLVAQPKQLDRRGGGEVKTPFMMSICAAATNNQKQPSCHSKVRSKLFLWRNGASNLKRPLKMHSSASKTMMICNPLIRATLATRAEIRLSREAISSEMTRGAQVGSVHQESPYPSKFKWTHPWFSRSVKRWLRRLISCPNPQSGQTSKRVIRYASRSSRLRSKLKSWTLRKQSWFTGQARTITFRSDRLSPRRLNHYGTPTMRSTTCRSSQPTRAMLKARS